MQLTLTTQQVEALAPDRASIGKAKKLAEAVHWRILGRSERALWGQCRGSTVYDVQVDLSDLQSRCTCPSRKRPCKHVLGLLILAAQTPMAVAPASEPEAVADWLGRRAAAAAAKATKREAKAAGKKPVDPEAQAKRAERRAERVGDGLEQLDRWLRDLVRVGLATVEDSSPGIFEEQARRLVDAQASGLAGWIRRLGAIPLSGPDWPDRLLRQLGRVALLIRAFRRLDALPPELQLELRAILGWSVPKEQVLAEGERVADRWQVVAQELSEEDRLRTQRSWLIGQDTGERALVLQFAYGAQAIFDERLLLGSEFEAELAFYPGAARQRALIVRRDGVASSIARLAGARPIAALLDEVSRAVARQPWLERFGAVLRDVSAVQGADGRLRLVDAAGDHVAVTSADPYLLLAISGGEAIDVAGEWDGDAFYPFLTADGDRFYLLQPSLLAPPPS
ncbi:MAG: SWIM zinc finger family protein [Nannocystaceae bacterium]